MNKDSILRVVACFVKISNQEFKFMNTGVAVVFAVCAVPAVWYSQPNHYVFCLVEVLIMLAWMLVDTGIEWCVQNADFDSVISS